MKTNRFKMWDPNDQSAFQYETGVMMRGQVGSDSALGRCIQRLASHPDLHRFMEIGTWNGLGSTMRFYDAFRQRNDTDFSLDSLESNRDKYDIAKKLYAHRSAWIRLHHAVITHDLPSFETIVQEVGIAPEDVESIRTWHHVDVENVRRAPLFIPPFTSASESTFDRVYDVILMDGGECTTYYEFHIVKDWTNILILDDIGTYKCRAIVDLLRKDEEWVEEFADDNDRNGCACFRRADFSLRDPTQSTPTSCTTRPHTQHATDESRPH